MPIFTFKSLKFYLQIYKAYWKLKSLKKYVDTNKILYFKVFCFIKQNIQYKQNMFNKTFLFTF